MTEDVQNTETAGSMLRTARQAAGVHISVLAMRLKVPVSKIEGLENDRLDVFADPVFARTLAMSACKLLRIDHAPVLALLPKALPPRLDVDETSLNQRFIGEGSRRKHPWQLALKNPIVMAVPALILAALLLYFWPVLFPIQTASDEPVMPPNTPVQIEAPKESSSEPSTPASGPVAPTVPTAERTLPAPASASLSVSGPVLPLELKSSAVSWVQITDARGVVVFSKTLQAGEIAQAQGEPPLKLVVGNAANTQIMVKDRAFDFQPFVVNNVARFEIQP